MIKFAWDRKEFQMAQLQESSVAAPETLQELRCQIFARRASLAIDVRSDGVEAIQRTGEDKGEEWGSFGEGRPHCPVL